MYLICDLRSEPGHVACSHYAIRRIRRLHNHVPVQDRRGAHAGLTLVA